MSGRGPRCLERAFQNLVPGETSILELTRKHSRSEQPWSPAATLGMCQVNGFSLPDPSAQEIISVISDVAFDRRKCNETVAVSGVASQKRATLNGDRSGRSYAKRDPAASIEQVPLPETCREKMRCVKQLGQCQMERNFVHHVAKRQVRVALLHA